MRGLSLFLEDLTEELDDVQRCKHCGQPIVPCDCGSGLHWQDAQASPGQGNMHCLGMPHQLHEPCHV